MSRLTKYCIDGYIASNFAYDFVFGMPNEDFKGFEEMVAKLGHYEDMEEQDRLINWRKTAEEKPDSTRHLIVADGEIISHYGYYLKPKDKWFTNWKCEEEISTPMFWMDMPEPPKESLHSDYVAKMNEVGE